MADGSRTSGLDILKERVGQLQVEEDNNVIADVVSVNQVEVRIQESEVYSR